MVKRNANGARIASSLVPYLGWLLFHELAHAADYMQPTNIVRLGSSSSPNDVADNTLSKSLNRRLPLSSGVMKGLASVQFRGVSPNAEQLALRPRHVSEEFSGDRAIDFYSYLTNQEDLADLFDTTMTKYAFGYDTALAITSVPESGDRYDGIVAWGQRGRIADSRVKARARMAVQGIYADKSDVISQVESHLDSLPAPQPMETGRSFGEILFPSNEQSLRRKFGRMDGLSEEDILLWPE